MDQEHHRVGLLLARKANGQTIQPANDCRTRAEHIKENNGIFPEKNAFIERK